MDFGALAGGFAQSFGQSFAQGREQKRLRDVMQLEAGERIMDRQMAERGMALQEAQAKSVEEHRAWQENFQVQQLKLQQQQFDMEVFRGLTTIMDSKVSPQAKKLFLSQMAPKLGVDTKSQEFKDLSTFLTSGAPELQEWREILSQSFPGMQPGQLTALAQGLFSGKVQVNDLPTLLGTEGEQNLEVKPFVDPESGKTIYGSEEEVLGKEVPPSSPQVSITQMGESEQAKMFARIGEKYATEVIEDAASAPRVQMAARRVKNALKSGKFTTGPASGPRRFLGEIMQFVGGDPELGGILTGNDPVTAEEMENASLTLVAGMADQMSKLTNMSLQFVRDQGPSLAKTPEGNAIIADTMELNASHQIELGRLLEKYAEKGSFTPEGMPSFYEERDRLQRDWQEEYEAIETRWHKEFEKSKGINWDEVPGVGEAISDAMGEGETEAIPTPPAAVMGRPEGEVGYNRETGEWWIKENGTWVKVPAE